MTLELELRGQLPFFAEIPYYLWGETSYDSDGDCKRPTDRMWTSLYLRNRRNRERVVVEGGNGRFTIETEDKGLAQRTALFLSTRAGAADAQYALNGWDHAGGMRRSARVRHEFPREDLKPFDNMHFWGSWKWVGGFASEFTWVGRWIMNSVLTRDTRAVLLCVDWLRDGATPPVAAALCHALGRLTNERFDGPDGWLGWYDTSGRQRYPKPDFKAWQAELKKQDMNWSEPPAS